MKEKCQCLPPKDTLNIRKADRYCEKCGVALCEDCSVDFFYDWHHWICRTCAEMEE